MISILYNCIFIVIFTLYNCPTCLIMAIRFQCSCVYRSSGGDNMDLLIPDAIFKYVILEWIHNSVGLYQCQNHWNNRDQTRAQVRSNTKKLQRILFFFTLYLDIIMRLYPMMWNDCVTAKERDWKPNPHNGINFHDVERQPGDGLENQITSGFFWHIILQQLGFK